MRKYHTNIHKCLQYVMQLDIIDRNPADRMALPKKQHRQGGTVYSAEALYQLMGFFKAMFWKPSSS